MKKHLGVGIIFVEYPMKFGIVVFPGTWSDGDCYHVLDQVLRQDVSYVWHKESDLSSYDCLVLPGGFSYGDYLRCGAIARFSPIMRSLEEFADQGKCVIGICNGFQILCESGLLPGVLMRNDHLQFQCSWVNLRVENPDPPFTSMYQTGQVVRMPISNGEGRYYADDATIRGLEESGRVAFRYCDEDGHIIEGANPNGSINGIAGITNREGNVLGMMPHPERCCEEMLGGIDGKYLFESVVVS